MLHSDHMDQWCSLHVNVFCSPLVYASTSCSHDGGGSISSYIMAPASPTDSPHSIEIDCTICKSSHGMFSRVPPFCQSLARGISSLNTRESSGGSCLEVTLEVL